MQKELYKIPATSLLEMFKRKETNPLEVSLEIIKNLKIIIKKLMLLLNTMKIKL